MYKFQADDTVMKKCSEDATSFSAKFDEAMQFSQERFQHHIHPKIAGTDKRYIPKTCQMKKCEEQCKHDFGKTAWMNLGDAELLCMGLCKAKGLRHSGHKTMVGMILPRRNDEWLGSRDHLFSNAE